MSTSLLHTLYIKSSPLLILVDFIMSFICLDLVSSSEFICFLVVCPTLAVLMSAAHGVRMACWVLKEDSNSDAPCTVGDQRCGVVMPMPRMAQVWWAEAAEGLTRVAEGTRLQINLCRCPLGGCRIV